MENLIAFQFMGSSLGGMALLMLIQILVADILAIKAKQIPGTPVEANHSNMLFRATRTVANTNESIAIFILVLIFCMLSEASPLYTGYLSWGFVLSRIAYAVCYYLNLKLLRSVVFGISLVLLLALLVVGMTS